LAREADHGRILAAAARDALTPLGFWRKSRSRIWLADRGLWLAVVEFQPSSFKKGSYLNVAAHWFWSAMPDVLSFNYIVKRSKPWIEFKDAEQFAPLAGHLAHQAADESRQLQARFADSRSTAAMLAAEHAALADAGRGGGWPAFDAAVAAGIDGDIATAQRLLDSACDSIGAWRPDLQKLLVPYLDAVKTQATFKEFIADLVDAQRAHYGLAPISGLSEMRTTMAL
jgi:hypothetical protein